LVSTRSPILTYRFPNKSTKSSPVLDVEHPNIPLAAKWIKKNMEAINRVITTINWDITPISG
jgi:hypothetical protein